MNKKFAIVMALFLTLAGCTESVEEEIKEIVEIPGCNDDTAFNYDENATNTDACLTELALEQAIMDFMTAIEQGPTDANSSMGMTITSSSYDGMESSVEMVFSPNGIAMFTSMSGEIDLSMMSPDSGMMPFEYLTEQTIVPNPDGTDTTVIHMVYMDESQEFTMNNAVRWSVIISEMMDDDDDDHGDDDMDGDHEDHGDDMGMGMETPEPPEGDDVLSGFDVANSTYALALSTGSGYSFTSTVTEVGENESGASMDITSTFTFVLNTAFEVTSVSVTESIPTDGTNTMTVTLLSDAEIAGYFDADWSSIATEALPFAVMPMDGGHDDHGDDDHGDHDDHGDDDHGDLGDHGDDDHDDGDHGDHHDGPTFICGDGTEIPFDYVNDGEADCDDGADEQQYDSDGTEINWFDCMDGSQVWISQVNDGTDDCPDGDDEAYDDDHDDHHDGPTFICGDGTEIPFDYVNDGEADCDDGADEQQYDSDGTEINWFDCMDGSQVWISQVNDGTDDCPDGDDEAYDDDHDDHHHGDDHSTIYDGCTVSTDPHDSYYECWMNEWLDDDGEIMMSDGYEMDECEELPDSTWECEHHYDHDDHDDMELPSESEMFEMFDADEDGLLTLDEVMNGLENMDEEIPTPEEALEEGDSDNSGGLSWDEFVELWNSEEDEDDPEDNHLNNSPALEADFHEAFNNSDDDGSGELEEEELQDFIDLVSELSSDEHEHDRTFVCSSTVGGTPDMEIAFELVNDGTEDCGDGSDEPQDMDATIDSDGDGIIDNDVDNWFECYNGDNVSMNHVNDGNEDCSMGEDEHDSEPWMMFTDCTDMSGSSPDGGSMWECFVDMDDDGTLTSEESMGMWYVCELITMADGDMWFCEPQHEEEAMSLDAVLMFFNAADEDDDGMLSSDEFTFLYSIFDSGPDGPSADILFVIFDTDGDGEVTASEYSDYLNASDVDSFTYEELVTLLDEYDLDDSGGLNIDEISEFWDMTDDDHDDHDHGDHGDDGDHGDHDGHDHGDHDDDGDHGDHDGHDHDDHGDDDHGDHGDDGDHDDHSGHDHGDHDGHMHGPLDWIIVETDTMADMPPMAGDLSNYYAVLSKCTIVEDSDGEDDDMMMMGMGGAPEMDCGPDILFTPLSSATDPNSIYFHDADSSGTLTFGDMVHVSENATNEEWTHVRLYSASADAYSDENPMMTPGFTGLIGMIALLGAALLTRRD